LSTVAPFYRRSGGAGVCQHPAAATAFVAVERPSSDRRFSMLEPCPRLWFIDHVYRLSIIDYRLSIIDF
jgi:hypothetical protein